MKSTFKIPGFRTHVAYLLTLFLLWGGGSISVSAQNATNAPTSPVAQYPKDAESVLPGKGPLVTGSWFPPLWAQRHAQWAKTAAHDKGAVVFLGDSITQGWHSLANAFPNIRVANRGISGDTTRGVLYRLKDDVLDLNPEAVVLLIGTNDIGLGGNPDDAVDNIKAILQALRNFNPNMPIIVCKVMPRSDCTPSVADKIQKLNALLEDYVKGQPNLFLCDTWSIYADRNGDCSKDVFPDLLHPNAIGYEKWAAALKPIFLKLHLTGESTP